MHFDTCAPVGLEWAAPSEVKPAVVTDLLRVHEYDYLLHIEVTEGRERGLYTYILLSITLVAPLSPPPHLLVKLFRKTSGIRYSSVGMIVISWFVKSTRQIDV